MTSLINIPYLTSGKQLIHLDKIDNIRTKIYENKDNDNRNENIIKRRNEYLKLASGFREASNYNTFVKKYE